MLQFLCKRVLLLPSVQRAQYHCTPALAAGRWGGDKADEARPRSLSARQKKRKRAVISQKANKVDKTKMKLKDNFVQSQIQSPDFQKLLTQEDPGLNAVVRRMMLPDDVSMPDLDGAPAGGKQPMQPLEVLTQISSGLEDSKASGESSQIENEALSVHVGKKEANNALKTLAALRDVENTEKMLSAMVDRNIPFQHSSIIDVLTMYNTEKTYDKTIKMFDELEKYSMPHPNPFAWACLITAKTENGNGKVDEGINLLKFLEKRGVTLLADMYNPILRGLIKNARHDEASDHWVGMKIRGINPNIESYNIMVEQCEYRGQPERAFFLMDELKLAQLTPTKETFCNLIRACSTAPVWVNGYQDIVSDALAKMEGQELIPNAEVYNSIIYAFAKAGDAAAADFYLQEMKRKKIHPTVKSYNYLFNAFATNQMVGARYYGKFGRYVRPDPPPDSERQKLYKEAGFDVVNEELSKTFIKDGPPERGKRVKMQYEDMAEFDEEAQETFDQNLRLEINARNMRQKRQEQKMAMLASSKSQSDDEKYLPEEDTFAKLGAGEGTSEGNMLGDDNVRKLMEADNGEISDMLKRIKENGDIPEGEESLEYLMKQLNDENDNGDFDPGAFLNEEDKKEWEKFLQEMEQPQMDENGNAVTKETVEDDSDMIGSLESILAKMKNTEEESDGDKVGIRTSEKDLIDAQATVDAFKTLNSLLGHLDDASGGVAIKEHYVSSNKSITGGELKLDSEGLVHTDEIDRMWNLVEFGRPPKPDYSDSLRTRRSKNIDRAMELYEEMCHRENLKPNENTLAALIGVVGNATLHRKAEALIEKFKTEHGVSLNNKGHDAIIKMHIIRHDISSALEAKNRMRELGMYPSRDIYGMLLQSLSARKMIEEALLTLEESADRGIKIRDVYLRPLRHECKKLGITHPDIPEDPMAWVNAVKEARKNSKNRSRSRVQPVQSGMFNT